MDSNKIVGQLFKDGQLSSNFEYLFNESGKPIREMISSKLLLIGWQSKIIEFEHENGSLILQRKLSKDLLVNGIYSI